MVPVAATADGEAIAARPWQVCGCDEFVGVARWVPPFDECLRCGATWVSMPPFGEEP